MCKLGVNDNAAKAALWCSPLSLIKQGNYCIDKCSFKTPVSGAKARGKAVDYLIISHVMYMMIFVEL